MNRQDRDNVVTVVETFCDLLEAAVGRGAVMTDARSCLRDTLLFFEREILPRAGRSFATALFGEDIVVLDVDLRQEEPRMMVFIYSHPKERPKDMPVGQAHITWQRLRDKCAAKGLDRDWFNSHVLFSN